MSRRLRVGGVALAVAAMVALSGCTSPIDPVEPTPEPDAAAPAASGDGTLLFGTLFSTRTDPLAAARIAGVELAVWEINDAGGVLDVPVMAFHRDAGDPAAEAEEGMLEDSFAALVASGVDVIIGPADTGMLDRVEVLAAEAGIAVIPQTGDPVDVDEDFAERVQSMDPGVRDATSAREAYDATITAAVAAARAGDDSGESVAFFSATLAEGEIECTSFGECVHILEDREDIRYVGVAAPATVLFTEPVPEDGETDGDTDGTPEDDE